jgi:adenine-specific DNA-methyltransferase
MPVSQELRNIDTTEVRKARGAFFTPREITDFIASWAIRTKSDLTLEPSCGEASFLLSAAARLKKLGALSDDGITLLHGIEIHDASVTEATTILQSAGLESNVRRGNFFDFSPGRNYDVVIGNPPYVRYQDFTGTARAKGLEAALAQGVRLSLLANSWAPFVIHAAQFLKPNGRLGLVLPAELLTVKYATEIRRFLLNRFSSIKLVMFEELVFPGVLEEVVLLLAEGTGPTAGFELYQARNLNDLTGVRSNIWTQFTPSNVEKWTPALIPTDALDVYRNTTAQTNVETLLNWGESYLGAVTGNNKYFTLTGKQIVELGLTKQDLRPISPPGTRYLRGLTFTQKAWGELLRQDNRCYLFYPDKNDLSTNARDYIARGEAAEVHTSYKCRTRKPWWRVPLVPTADLFLTYMDHACPRLVTNDANVSHLNSVYGLKLRTDRRKLGQELLAVASLNSLTILGAEMVGRSYGGGVLKLEPNEADLLPLPAQPILEAAREELNALKPQLAIALRQGDTLRVVKAVDAVLLKKHLGMKPSALKVLREAREFLFCRRLGRGKNKRGTN